MQALTSVWVTKRSSGTVLRAGRKLEAPRSPDACCVRRHNTMLTPRHDSGTLGVCVMQQTH